MKCIIGAYSQFSYGTDDKSFETVLNRQIKPLLTLLYNNPSYKLLLRLDIAEFEWFEINHPEIIMLINDLCKKGQIELLTSSYYDSVINYVPSHERSVHIEKTTTYLRKRFSRKPKGLWMNYQIFSPSVIPVMELSALEYIFISTYQQSINTVLCNKPFFMNEMGKETVIFPTDDVFSKVLIESFKYEHKFEKIEEDIKKIIKSSSNVLTTYMVNLDFLTKYEDSSFVFNVLYSNTKNSSVLPEEYIASHEIAKYYYLPGGTYGRDYSFGKAFSINQYVFDNNTLSKNYFLYEKYRNIIKNVKKNCENRKLLDELLLEASSSALYIPLYSNNTSYRRYVSSKLCEIEKILLSDGLMPNNNEIEYTKNLLAFISPKGAYISRLNFINSFFDITLNSDIGLFCDFIKHNGKSINLNSKKFDISFVDKKRNDCNAICSDFYVDDYVLSLCKKYRFKQNTITVEYEINNKSNIEIKDLFIDTILNISLDQDPQFSIENRALPNLTIYGKKQSVSLFTDDSSLLSSKSIYANSPSVLGNKDIYQYTQIRINKNIYIKPMSTESFSISLKIDKLKEKNNDIKQ